MTDNKQDKKPTVPVVAADKPAATSPDRPQVTWGGNPSRKIKPNGWGQ